MRVGAGPPLTMMSANEAQPHVSELANGDLLATLDTVLLEIERRLLHYARSGSEIQAMADEGLVMATRTAARLRQAQSAAAHTAGHLQVVGVGNWHPKTINPSWSDDDRVTGPDSGEPGDHH
jgi:hypothetical protein